MAIDWADNFGIYGTGSVGAAAMLDGLYAEVGGIPVADPDPNAAPGSYALYVSSTERVRRVLSGDFAVVGVAQYVWKPSLPETGTNNDLFQFLDSAGATQVSVALTSTGAITVWRGAYDTLLASSDGPAIVSNAWQHIEVKVLFSQTVGTVEVRVGGVEKINATGLDTCASANASASQFRWGRAGTLGNENDAYFKRAVVWNGEGTRNNDFLGSVDVFWRPAASLIEAGGWTSSADAAADDTVAKPRLANTLTASGAISSGNQVRIADTYYAWTSGSVDAGTPAGTSGSPWLVAMGGDTAAALENLYAAIGGTGTPGTTYSTALVAHTTATPFGLTDTALAVIPTDGTTTSTTFSETGANTSWASTSAFFLGVHDAIRMAAGYTPAVAASGTITVSGGVPTVDQTFAIGGDTYTFKASAAAPFEVTIGGDAAATATNIIATITADDTEGVTATSGGSGIVTLTADAAGAAGNAITLTESASNVTVSGAGTLAGGSDLAFPTAFEVGLEALPADLTSIKAVIPIFRGAKVDGGDGSVQASFGISDPSYDAGPDNAISTAFTWWGNAASPFVSEENPLTNAPWTLADFNLGARLKVDRTG